MDTVAARFGTKIDDRITDTGSRSIKNLVGLGDPHRHGIDQNIAIITGMETELAAHCRHTEGIAVAADPCHHTCHQMAGARVGRITKAQGIQAGDRPRTHGKNITQNTAYARRCPLIGLDEGGVIVAFHFEHAGQPVADIDHTGIFARALDDPGRRSRQTLQMQPR